MVVNNRRKTGVARLSGRCSRSQELLRYSIAVLLLLPFLLCSSPRAQSKSQPRDARAAVQTFFTLLKSHKYAALYEFLPSQLQQQMTPLQLALSLKRLESQLVIERMETGRMQQKGDFAVVDTTIYGRLKKPLKVNGEEVTEGRVSVQQYLFKENNNWKIATADNRTKDYFLKNHPEFNKQFQFALPKFEFKQNGRWAPIVNAFKSSQ
jgi:hypothetical protein